MNDYYEVKIQVRPCTEDATDLLAACLAEVGYESFVPDETGLTAYVKSEDYSADALQQVVGDFPMQCSMEWTSTLVPGQDWNEEWEKNYFQPIVIGDECVIHSTFHHDVPEARYDIVIDPKMAFGTGHHDTTSLLIKQLLSMDLEGKKVVDMGTGTGILAILAAMRGATHVIGIEIDGFAYENAQENVKLNHHAEISLAHGDATALAGIKDADVLIANINRNVILADLEAYVDSVRQGGIILLSGFYDTDVDVLMEAAHKRHLTLANKKTEEKTRWTMLQLIKN